jgi:hypothetical protein
LAVGSWQLAVGSWQLAVGSWQLAVGSWQLAVGKFLKKFCGTSSHFFNVVLSEVEGSYTPINLVQPSSDPSTSLRMTMLLL